MQLAQDPFIELLTRWCPEAQVKDVRGNVYWVSLGNYAGRNRGPMTAAEKKDATERLLKMTDRFDDEYEPELVPHHKMYAAVLGFKDNRKAK
jgi:hypothetical protein